MTSCRPTAKLTAIYNLNFYRKKDNWKLCKKKDKEEKLSTSLRNPLNETYTVTNNVQDSPELNPLNVAFFDQEKAQSELNISSDHKEQPNKLYALNRLEALLNAAKEHEMATSPTTIGTISQENIPETYDFNLQEELVEDNWTDLCTNLSEPWMNRDDFVLNHDEIDGLSQSQVKPIGDWDLNYLLNHASNNSSVVLLNEKTDDLDLDSSSEFMEGAGNAPHSTVISISPERTILTFTVKKRSTPSKIEENRKWVTPSTKMTFEEYQKRRLTPIPRVDRIVAGSHLFNNIFEFVGRGRGRLRQNQKY